MDIYKIAVFTLMTVAVIPMVKFWLSSFRLIKAEKLLFSIRHHELVSLRADILADGLVTDQELERIRNLLEDAANQEQGLIPIRRAIRQHSRKGSDRYLEHFIHSSQLTRSPTD